MPTILLTRPYENSLQTAALLKAHGLNSFIEPVINIEFAEIDFSKLNLQINNNDGIIVTSRNAIKAIKNNAGIFNYNLITLGNNTTDFAKESGFTNVTCAGEDVEELCGYVKSHHAGKKFIYFSGEKITTELTRPNCGADVTRVPVYKTIAADNFTEEFKEEIKSGRMNAVLLLSTYTAEIFLNLLQQENLCSYTKKLYAFCLSKKISDFVSKNSDCAFKETIFPEKTNIDSIIKFMVNFKFA